MRFSTFVAIITGVLGSHVVADDSTLTAAASSACVELKKRFPAQTFYPIDLVNYLLETHQSWSTTAWLDPACVFTPTSASDVSWAIQTFKRLGANFAMRGGGHMPISDAANINSTGVLLSSTNLTGLSLSQNRSVVSVQAGNRWEDVYQFLEPYGLNVVGGRIGMVGVSGLILGGGISYFSNEYGLASSNNNVRAFECVLANGTIVEATQTNNSDLYWALKGGGNSFCFVTRFDLQTIYMPKVWVGLRTYTDSQTEQWLHSVVNFAFHGDEDVKGSIVPSVVLGPLQPSGFYTYTFYNGDNSSPTVLQNFSAPVLTPLITTWSKRSMYSYSIETEIVELAFRLHRQRFYGQSFRADVDALRAVHDIFTSSVKAQLYDILDLSATMDFNVVTKNMIRASNANGGNPQGLEESQGPYIWLNEILAYTNSAYDARIEQFLIDVNRNISAELNERGVDSKSIYLNEIDKGQPVFRGYPSQNVQRLKRIRAAYDPDMVFTKQVPGGFKIAYA